MGKYTKFYMAAMAFLGVIVSSGLLHGQVALYVNAAIAGVGAAAVYLFPNTPTNPPVTEGQAKRGL